MDLYASTALHDRLVARVLAESGLQSDRSITLHIDLRRIHLFGAGENVANLGRASELAHAG